MVKYLCGGVCGWVCNFGCLCACVIVLYLTFFLFSLSVMLVLLHFMRNKLN